MRRIWLMLAATAAVGAAAARPAVAIIYLPWTPPTATPKAGTDGENYSAASQIVVQMEQGSVTVYFLADDPDDVDKACDCSAYPHDAVTAFRWTIKRMSDQQTVATLYGQNVQHTFTQYEAYSVRLAINDAGNYADDPGGYLDQDPVLVIHVMGLEIIAAHDYVVPGSECNAIKYHVYPETFTEDEAVGRLEVRDYLDVLRREINWGYEECEGGEHLLQWNGKDGAGEPLTEADASYSFTIVIETDIGGDLSASLGNRGLKEWGIYVPVDDPPVEPGGFAVGIDEDTITTGLVSIVSAPCVPSCPIPEYWVIEDGTGSIIHLLDAPETYHLFYTNPTHDPNLSDLWYHLKMEASEQGILDECGNPFDADHEKWGRQHGVQWEFRITSAGDLDLDQVLTY